MERPRTKCAKWREKTTPETDVGECLSNHKIRSHDKIEMNLDSSVTTFTVAVLLYSAELH